MIENELQAIKDFVAKSSLLIDESHQLIKQNAKIHDAKLDRLIEMQASNQVKIEALSKVLQESKKPNWDKFWSTADIVLPTIIGFGVGVIFILLIPYK